MASAAVESSFDVAYWFIDRALNDNEYLQPQKLHRLMFLSQAYFAVAYRGRTLMPAVFIADEYGPIEPGVFRALAIQRPPIDPMPLPEMVSQFLDSIWRRFGQHSADYLSRLVAGHPPYRDALAKGSRTIITEEAMLAFYGRKAAAANVAAADPAGALGAPAVEQLIRPRLMRSQNGKAVAVRKWTPPSKK